MGAVVCTEYAFLTELPSLSSREPCAVATGGEAERTIAALCGALRPFTAIAAYWRSRRSTGPAPRA